MENLYIVHFEDGTGAYLAHHGVLGMKWGVRNAETQAKYAGKTSIVKVGDRNARSRSSNSSNNLARAKGAAAGLAMAGVVGLAVSPQGRAVISAGKMYVKDPRVRQLANAAFRSARQKAKGARAAADPLRGTSRKYRKKVKRMERFNSRRGVHTFNGTADLVAKGKRRRYTHQRDSQPYRLLT